MMGSEMNYISQAAGGILSANTLLAPIIPHAQRQEANSAQKPELVAVQWVSQQRQLLRVVKGREKAEKRRKGEADGNRCTHNLIGMMWVSGSENEITFQIGAASLNSTFHAPWGFSHLAQQPTCQGILGN